MGTLESRYITTGVLLVMKRQLAVPSGNAAFNWRKP
jgi:hypothetical protein